MFALHCVITNELEGCMVTFKFGLQSGCMASWGGGRHWQKLTTCDKKIASNIFIVGKFCIKCTCNIGDFKIVKHVYM